MGRHFEGLPVEQRARLAARGIDPELSCEAWLATIRDGSFPLSVSGRPLSDETREGKRRGALRTCVAPIPMAVVIP